MYNLFYRSAGATLRCFLPLILSLVRSLRNLPLHASIFQRQSRHSQSNSLARKAARETANGGRGEMRRHRSLARSDKVDSSACYRCGARETANGGRVGVTAMRFHRSSESRLFVAGRCQKRVRISREGCTRFEMSVGWPESRRDSIAAWASSLEERL